LFQNILNIQGGSTGGGSGGRKKEDIVKEYIKKFLEQLPNNFSMLDITIKIKVRDPYIVVCL
jgi:hypothetical protein